MKKKQFPFLPINEKLAEKIVPKLMWISDIMIKIFPDINLKLKEIGYEIDARKWFALSLISSLFYLFTSFIGLFFVFFSIYRDMSNAFQLSLVLAFLIFMFTFLSQSLHARIRFSAISKDVEKNIAYAISHMLIDVKSGIPLFKSIENISKQNYGTISEIMRRIVEEINIGKSEIDAMECVVKNINSSYFKRVMWQIINSMKSGSEISETLSDIMRQIGEEQKVAVKRYGSQLNPIALIYMLFSIIFPTIGASFLLILSTFLGININLQTVFIMIVFFLIVFQFIIISIAKQRRPLI